MDTTFFTRLLPDDFSAAQPQERLRAALAVDPALSGRLSCDDSGLIALTGPAGGPPPGSAKERQRWELHVRLRLAAELGESAAAAAVMRWADAPRAVTEPRFAEDGERYAAP